MFSRNKVPPKSADAIRIVLAALADRPQRRVQEALEQANMDPAHSPRVVFQVDTVAGRGIQILERAAKADVVLFGLEDNGLPGEASHVAAAYPDVKVIGVDDDAHVRIVLGAGSEPLSRDLPTVIRWITRRTDERSALHSQAR